MPTIFRIKGLRFFFYSNDHRPAHVHVEGYGNAAKIVLEPEIKLVSNNGFSPSDLKKILGLCKKLQSQFLESWEDFFDDQD